MSAKTDASDVFVDGPLPEALVADLLSGETGDVSTGARSLFLGTVRADVHDGSRVTALEYESYREMAEPVLRRILAEVRSEFGLANLQARHSLGHVRAGQCCFVVCAVSSRRAAAFDGCRSAVERIKKEVPIFARELLEDGSHRWKRNS